MKYIRTLFTIPKRPFPAADTDASKDAEQDNVLSMPLVRRQRQPAASQRQASDKSPLLQIACPDPTPEDQQRDTSLRDAQRLVRQENWEKLSAVIDQADTGRAMTEGGMPLAELMAFGARADVVLAAEHALLTGKPPPDAPLMAGIEALEHVLAEHTDNHIVAAIVAQAHIDIGWAWRGTGWQTDVPARNRDAFSAHFDRAADILAPFRIDEIPSPLLATTQCALLGGTDADRRKVADHYEKLIDLNPRNPRAMRAMGNHLLPRWHGSYAELELEARRTAARTQSIWGAGGYTWVQLDAISCDDQACANLDLPFFIEGLHDILTAQPAASTSNLLAAYCAITMAATVSPHDQATAIRAEIAECTNWIVREHLTEIHPMIWAHAGAGFDNNLRVPSARRFAATGRESAMRIITSQFQREISDGKHIVFTEQGPVAQTG